MIKKIFEGYHTLIRQILADGERRKDRTGVGTRSIFAPANLRFDLSYCFPAYWGRALPVEKFCAEALWFLKGCPDGARWLQKRGIGIWDKWANESGDLGRVYGQQWRRWVGCNSHNTHAANIDQLAGLIENLRTDPHSRRHLVTAWQPAELHLMALPPCHFGFNCYISNPDTDRAKLSLCVFLRSSDVIIGLPANIVNYAFIAHAIARAVGVGVGELVVNFVGDTHIYENLVPVAEELLTRGEYPAEEALPQLVWHTENTVVDAYDWHAKGNKDFTIKNYFPHTKIKTDVAV